MTGSIVFIFDFFNLKTLEIDTEMTKKRQDENDLFERFWNQYIEALRKRGVNKTVERWHVLRAERYIKAFSESRLAHHTANDVKAHFDQISREKKLKPWQFYQLVHAIQILFVDIVHSKWSGEFNWDYWLASAKELESDHPTVVRDNSKLAQQYENKNDFSTVKLKKTV
jgi:hypothetical protein